MASTDADAILTEMSIAAKAEHPGATDEEIKQIVLAKINADPELRARVGDFKAREEAIRKRLKRL